MGIKRFNGVVGCYVLLDILLENLNFIVILGHYTRQRDILVCNDTAVSIGVLATGIILRWTII